MSEQFDLTLSLDRISDGDHIDLVASEDECARVAARLGLLSLGTLKAHAALARDGERIVAKGRVQASLEQACIATGEPVPAMVDEPFDLNFLPEPRGTPDEEIELGGSELDTIFHDGAKIPLGDSIVDTLSLALDPYPRGPNADAALRDAGVLSEEDAGPFAALAALKEKMGKQP
jgi:uncharacterized metal-binding protein YceD (DUF177 family)